MVDAATGIASGLAFSNDVRDLLALSGTVAVSFDQNAAFVTGDTSTGATFRGKFDNADQVSGTWENASFAESGTFAGNRVGGVTNAQHRFTGRFAGGASGLFTFDVDASGAVAGIAYTAASGARPAALVNEQLGLSGTLTDTTLTAKTADNRVTITGTLSTTTGELTGTWVNANSNTGTFSGSGCRLN
jgi:hypothetical protein